MERLTALTEEDPHIIIEVSSDFLHFNAKESWIAERPVFLRNIGKHKSPRREGQNHRNPIWEYGVSRSRADRRRRTPVAEELLAVLKEWHNATDLSAPTDWVFASPVQLGRLPWSCDQTWCVYQKAATAAGIGSFGTHTLRHTYRSWLDAVGTGLTVQQKLMRHTDIRTTMKYGDIVTDEMEQAHQKVVGLAMNGSQSGLQRP